MPAVTPTWLREGLEAEPAPDAEPEGVILRGCEDERSLRRQLRVEEVGPVDPPGEYHRQALGEGELELGEAGAVPVGAGIVFGRHESAARVDEAVPI